MARKEDPMEMIRADIEKKFNSAVKEMAEEMNFQIESAYESVIQKFYDEYTPRSYERTYSTYLGSDKYDNLFGFTPVDDGYEVGVRVGDENIPGNPYRAEKDWVFRRTFEEGIHGYFKVEYQQWYADRVKKHKWSKKKAAREKARADKMIAHAPRKSTPPKKNMDAKFKKLTNKTYMNKISKSIMAKYFQ